MFAWKRTSLKLGMLASLLALGVCLAPDAAWAIEPPENLGEAINGALNNHPEIIVARASLQQAQAEYDSARLEVVRKVAASWNELVKHRNLVEQAKRALTETSDPATKRLLEVQLVDAQAQLEVLTTEMHYMVAHTGGAYQQNGGQAPVVEPKVPQTALARQTAEKLTTVLDLEFVDAPLADVVTYLADRTKTNIRIQAGAGLEETTVSMTLKGVPFAGAIEAIEDATGAQFVIRNYGLLVIDSGSAESLGYLQVTRYATEHLGMDLQAEAQAPAAAK